MAARGGRGGGSGVARPVTSSVAAGFATERTTIGRRSLRRALGPGPIPRGSNARLGAVGFVRNFVQFFVLALWVLMLGRVLISWVDSTGRSQVSRFLFQVTEPILAPVRRILPSTGMIDLSPMIVILILSFIASAFRA